MAIVIDPALKNLGFTERLAHEKKVNDQLLSEAKKASLKEHGKPAHQRDPFILWGFLEI